MNYIVLDLEWNQSNHGKEYGNKEIPFEIIEIGAVKLNDAKEIIGEFNELVKPTVYRELHHITEKLLQIPIEELNDKRKFEEVIHDFLEWCGKDYVFATWGPLDLIELQRNMRYHYIDGLSVGPLPFLDIQKLFSFQYEDKKSRRTLEYAVDYLTITKDIPFHRAFSDAYYTAKVFAKINDPDVLAHVSFDLFHAPTNKKEEVNIIFSDYSKHISREFDEKVEAMKDREVLSTKCYLCGRKAKKFIKWFSPNGKHYYSVSECPKHGYLKGKIRLKKSENDKVFIIKTLKLVDATEVEKINRRKIKAKNREY